MTAKKKFKFIKLPVREEPQSRAIEIDACRGEMSWPEILAQLQKDLPKSGSEKKIIDIGRVSIVCSDWCFVIKYFMPPSKDQLEEAEENFRNKMEGYQDWAQEFSKELAEYNRAEEIKQKAAEQKKLDRKRQVEEEKQMRSKALAKLSPQEKELLGL